MDGYIFFMKADVFSNHLVIVIIMFLTSLLSFFYETIRSDADFYDLKHQVIGNFNIFLHIKAILLKKTELIPLLDHCVAIVYTISGILILN